MKAKNQNILLWAVLVLLALDLCASAALWLAERGSSDTHYTVYIGLNDRDTCRQEIPTEEARTIVDAICLKYADGYTIYDGAGAARGIRRNGCHDRGDHGRCDLPLRRSRGVSADDRK